MARVFLRIHNLAGKRLMKWPANSSDLNPIKNLRTIVKAKLYEGGKQYNNENELDQNSSNIEPNTIQNLTKSMDKRIVTILKNQGSYAMSIIRSNINLFR